MRLFAGIALDDPARAACIDAQARLRRAAFDAAYELPEKLHITLAFLGNVRDERVADVVNVLETTAAAGRPFELILDRAGAFPNERRPRIVFVGSRSQEAAFRTLARDLHEGYAALGFDFKEDPVAHVTIARVKGGSRDPLPSIDVGPQVMPVREITLFESHPDRYTARHSVILSGGA